MMRSWQLLGTVLYWLTLPLIAVYSRATKPRTRVLIIHDNKILIVKNWLGSGGWSLPGGGLHSNEAPEVGAVREVEEELGIAIDSKQLISLGEHVSVEQRFLSSKYHLFAVQITEIPNLKLQKMEIMDASWLSLADVDNSDLKLAQTVRDAVATWSKA